MKGLKEILFYSSFEAKQKHKRKEEEREAFIRDFYDLKLRLQSIESRFNITSDPDLVEALIYEESALKSRYSFMIKIARQKGISVI